RVLLDIVDALASTLYEPEPLPVTARLWNPDGAFSRAVRAAVGEFAQLVGLDVESLPRLLPWHQPYFVFDPERQAIFYPDVDGLPHEVAAFHVQFVGGNVTSACQALSALAPATVAHELVHALREHAGLLTDDHWHEEYVANRLAVGFLRGTDATRWEICRRLVRGACERGSRHLDETAHAILLRSAEPALAGGSPGLGSLTDYGVSLETSAAIHWQMVDQLMDAEPSFEEDLAEYVGLRRQDELAAE
ncbi:MAG TPA: hypothetical protein VLC09_17335, partial [Polyangiaceae bacterium]|nr:hypothetical protein [Polyangiaceae bacterium]